MKSKSTIHINDFNKKDILLGKKKPDLYLLNKYVNKWDTSGTVILSHMKKSISPKIASFPIRPVTFKQITWIFNFFLCARDNACERILYPIFSF